MNIVKQTTSLCPICFEEISAMIQVNNQDVMIYKTCPDHGMFDALIEKDPIFYMLGGQLDRGNIYNGLFVDVTSKCNTKCKYCYYDVKDSEPSYESIMKHCQDNPNLAPFIMIGGEPTMRNDLPALMRDISKIGPVVLTTNGLKLSDKEYLKELDALVWPGVFNASISLHPEKNNRGNDHAKKMKAIDNILANNDKLYGLIFVIDSLNQIDEVVYINRYFNKKIMDTRIKIATEINETKSGSQLFNSDVWEYLNNKAKSENVGFGINHDACNKAAYFNMVYDGINITSVKWYTKYNVDLQDIDCGPWHLNKNGKILNMDHSLILGG